VRYLLDCLDCGERIGTADSIGDPEIAAVERHLHAAHPDKLPGAGRRLDFAEILGHVRVRMGDAPTRAPQPKPRK